MSYHLGISVHQNPGRERVVRVHMEGTPSEPVLETFAPAFSELLEEHAGHRWIVDLRQFHGGAYGMAGPGERRTFVIPGS